jgi:hypothetical protein|nr:MAG TPA: hypothetical protein [Caudoviricetes sp.]
MKKRYKGYFKKPTYTTRDIIIKKKMMESFNFKEKPRVGSWVNTYKKYINKL